MKPISLLREMTLPELQEEVSRVSSVVRGLETRIVDLEGHAEHSSDTQCGVCAGPEPEYSDIARASMTDHCSAEVCQVRHTGTILPGDSIQARLGTQEWVHSECL
jgi:hypothetical protein